MRRRLSRKAPPRCSGLVRAITTANVSHCAASGMCGGVSGEVSFDVLVVGSGASGPRRRRLRRARRRARCRRDEGVAAGEQLVEGAGRHPGGLRRRRLARAARRGRLAQLPRDRRHRELVEVLTGEAPAAIHWLEELGVEFTRENGGYRLARCGGASRKRLLQVGDRTGHAITKALRDAWEAGSGTSFANAPLRALEPRRERLARDLRRARDRRGAPSSSPPAAAASPSPQERGELSTNHPERDRRGDADRARPRRRDA